MRNITSRRFQALKGSSIAEYIFIAALAAIACITAITLLGENVIKSTQGVKEDMKMRASAAESVQKEIAAEKAAWEAAQAAANSPTSNSANSSRVCSGSFCVYVPSATETSGGNGATSFSKQAAENLARIVQYLEEQNADPTLINLITGLANAGHTFAGAQKSLWGCTSGSRCVPTLKSSQADIKSSLADFNKLSGQLNKYLAANPGSLPANMQAVVNYDTTQIQGIGKGYKISSGSDYSFSYGGNPASTKFYSNDICKNGGNHPECTK